MKSTFLVGCVALFGRNYVIRISVGYFINDHTVYRHTDGSWHLIGITSPKFPSTPEDEIYLAHGVGKQLIEPNGYSDAPIIADHNEKAWAPHAVFHDGLVYLFYSPVSFKLITSKDMVNWAKLTFCLKGKNEITQGIALWILY